MDTYGDIRVIVPFAVVPVLVGSVIGLSIGPANGSILRGIFAGALGGGLGALAGYSALRMDPEFILRVTGGGFANFGARDVILWLPLGGCILGGILFASIGSTPKGTSIQQAIVAGGSRQLQALATAGQAIGRGFTGFKANFFRLPAFFILSSILHVVLICVCWLTFSGLAEILIYLGSLVFGGWPEAIVETWLHSFYMWGSMFGQGQFSGSLWGESWSLLGLVDLQQAPFFLHMLLSYCSLAVATSLVSLGWMAIGLKIVRGEKPGIGLIFTGFRKVVPVTGFAIVLGFGCALLSVATIFFSTLIGMFLVTGLPEMGEEYGWVMYAFHHSSFALQLPLLRGDFLPVSAYLFGWMSFFVFWVMVDRNIGLRAAIATAIKTTWRYKGRLLLLTLLLALVHCVVIAVVVAAAYFVLLDIPPYSLGIRRVAFLVFIVFLPFLVAFPVLVSLSFISMAHIYEGITREAPAHVSNDSTAE